MQYKKLIFTDNNAQSLPMNGTLKAVSVTGTVTNFAIADDFNGSIATATAGRTDLTSGNWSVTEDNPVSFTPTGVSGTVTVEVHWVYV